MNKQGGLMIHTDCAAYNKGTRQWCSACEKLDCAHGDCAFYKTKAQAEADRRKSFERRLELGKTLTAFDADYIGEILGKAE